MFISLSSSLSPPPLRRAPLPQPQPCAPRQMYTDPSATGYHPHNVGQQHQGEFVICDVQCVGTCVCGCVGVWRGHVSCICCMGHGKVLSYSETWLRRPPVGQF